MRASYDFSAGVRGKYLKRYRRSTNVVVLDKDVQRAFPDGEAVNSALRELMQLASRSVKPSARRLAPR
jgi:hypothetical protein